MNRAIDYAEFDRVALPVKHGLDGGAAHKIVRSEVDVDHTSLAPLSRELVIILDNHEVADLEVLPGDLPLLTLLEGVEVFHMPPSPEMLGHPLHFLPLVQRRSLVQGNGRLGNR